jgi:hypothetical protein
MSVKLVIECETMEELVREIGKLELPNSGAPEINPPKSEGEIIDIQPEPEPELDLEAVDGTGFRWDERIHSSSKKQTAKGLWKMKRGVSPALIAQVKKEQSQATVDIPPTMPPPPPPPPEPNVVVDVAAVFNFMSENDISLYDLNAIAKNAGLDSIAHLTTAPAKAPEILAALKAHVG